LETGGGGEKIVSPASTQQIYTSGGKTFQERSDHWGRGKKEIVNFSEKGLGGESSQGKRGIVFLTRENGGRLKLQRPSKEKNPTV